MYAIASLLDPVSTQTVQDLWKRLEERCGLTGIKALPLPHFSWLGVQNYETERVESALKEISEEIQPFQVRVSGLGVFTGRLPVLYITVVKDDTLLNLHRVIWDRVYPDTVQANMYYDPGHWIPHITLALRESDINRMGCAIADMALMPVEFETNVNNIAILFQQNGLTGMKERFDFRKQIEMKED